MTLNLAKESTRQTIVCSTQHNNRFGLPAESDKCSYRDDGHNACVTKGSGSKIMQSSESVDSRYTIVGMAKDQDAKKVFKTGEQFSFDPTSRTSIAHPDVKRNPEAPSAPFNPKQSGATAATTTPYDLQIVGGGRYGQRGFSSHQSDAGYRNLEVRVVRPHPLKTPLPKVVGAERGKSQSSHVSLTAYELQPRQRDEFQHPDPSSTESKGGGKADQKKSFAIGQHLRIFQCHFPQIIDTRMPPTMGRTNSDESSSNHGAEHPARDQRARDTRNTSVVSAPGADMFGGEDGDQPRVIHPTPLFERLVTEEVQELKAYARIIENQNRRLAELERVHGDLERRLEAESQRRRKLEATLESREKEWKQQFEKLVVERDSCREDVQLERTKNSRLIDQINRKDQDIHRMLQRKYDNDGGRSIRNIRPAPSERFDRPASTSSTPKSPDYHKSPQDLLNSIGSAEKVRVGNVHDLLLDFFGM